jgi:subtilase family serine protease
MKAMSQKIVALAMLVVPFAPVLIPASHAQNTNNLKIAAEVPELTDIQDLGYRDPGQVIDILVSLRFNREEELSKLVEEQSDRTSPNYHRYLSALEFAARFGPTMEQVNEVVAKLTAAGFQVSDVAGNRMQIYASAPSVTVETYFKTEIHTVTQGSFGERYTNLTPALLPTELEATVQAVVMDNLIVGSRTSDQIDPLPLGTPYRGPQDGIGPATIATAFDFPVQHGYDGTGRAAAIIIDSDVKQTDLTTYWTHFNISHTGTVTREAVLKGKVGKYTSGQKEATLDTETITGLAPGADVIIYITEELNHMTRDAAANQIVSENKVAAVNMSFGQTENVDTAFEADLKAGNALGITFVASGGDYGSDHGKVLVPAAEPHVLAVGGTELTANKSTGAYVSQIAWPHSGGGVSKLFPIPQYQVGVTGLASEKKRNLPDIAFPAYNDSRFVNGAWDIVAGTSWSSPTYVALQLEIDQLQETRFGWVNPNVYTAFSASSYNDFFDITKGSNGMYKCTQGYDNVTGIGSPKGWTLANDPNF